MTIEDYRADKRRMRFARKAVDSMPTDPKETARDLARNHHGQHVACLSCAIVALYFDAEVVVTERRG